MNEGGAVLGAWSEVGDIDAGVSVSVVSPEGWSSTRGGSSTIGVVELWNLGDTVGSDDPVDMGLGVELIAGSVGRGGGGMGAWVLVSCMSSLDPCLALLRADR